MKGQRKRIVVVLGMHRSGTSALARGLVPLGVDLGDRLMPAVPGNNERGFWEDLDVHGLNAQLLQALGREWDTLTPLDPAELMRHDLHPFRVAATDLLREKLADKRVYGLKDPQLCLLLPFWKPLFAASGADVDYVIATRHPLSVAESLQKRDGMELEKSLYLWLNHAASAVNDSVGARRVVVSYDLLMREPEAQLRRIADGLGLAFDPAASEFREFAEGFLSKDLRHSVFEATDLESAPGIAEDVVRTHELLEKLARDEVAVDSKPVSDFFHAVTLRLFGMRPALAYMSRRDSEFRQLKHNEQIHALQLAVSNRDGLIHGLNVTVGERDAKIAMLMGAETERDSLRAELVAARLAIESASLQVRNLHKAIAHAMREESDATRKSLSGIVAGAAAAGASATCALKPLEAAAGEFAATMTALADALGNESAAGVANQIEDALAARRVAWERVSQAFADLALALQQFEGETEINRLRLVDSLREAARRQREQLGRVQDLENAAVARDQELRERDRLLGQFGHQFVSRVGSMLDPYPAVRGVITAPLRLVHWLIGQARA